MVRETFVRDDHGRIVGVMAAEVDVQLAVTSSMGEDALRRKVRLIPFGTGLHVASTIELDPGSGQLRLEAIEDRAPGSETVILSVAPSMLSACVDALPALAEFPYGCTEQTLSRFVPAVAVRTVATAIGAKASRIDPELDAKIREGLQKIASMQDDSGGWGWWSGGRSDPYITSYAVMALSRARIDGVSVSRNMLTRGRDALRSMLTEIERRPDDLAYALFAIAQADEALHGDRQVRNDEAMVRWAGQLFEDRDELSAYARALLARVLMRYGSRDVSVLLLRHLNNDVRINSTVDTAHWGETRNYYWRGQGAVESTAFVLQAFVEVDPGHRLRAQAARWLVLNRRGNQWDSTRSSAHAIYALCDHLKDSDELRPEYTLTVSQRGEELLKLDIGPNDLIDGGGRFELPAEVLDHGAIDVQLDGTGRAYLTLEADAFSRAREIEPTGHGVEITREVVRLRPQRTLGSGVVNFEEALDASSRLDSGERIRIRLRLVAHHDVDYVMVEDPRAAGFEPIERSGRFGTHGLHGRREVRDDRTAFFVTHLGEGEHVIEYELRAESPGSYHVAPARALAMYLPDVAGHSAHEDLVVEARPEASKQGR
jgi:uncharacterized protein YfaS (alpha-2-macroglobulin family)